MSRYIDTDKVLEIAMIHKDFEQCIADLVSLKEVLHDTPTADVTAIVRCKDCKHFRFSDFSDMYGECSRDIRIVKPDGFCSYGERKDE